MKIKNPIRNINKLVLFSILSLALYAPAKDAFDYAEQFFAKQSIEIVDASFGGKTPWQKTSGYSFVKVSQNAQSSLSHPQIIYTRLKLTNPTNQPQTYRKIWLSFDHQDGSEEYTTDYTLYDPQTNQRLIGQTIQLGANSSVDVIAAYRFIPSYHNETPVTMSVSWEGQNLMREHACDYNLKTSSQNYFNYQCKG